MIKPDDVIKLCELFSTHNIPFWLTGGWGIDALLGEHTRPHKDLDVFVLVDDVVRLCQLLSLQGYEQGKLWSENRLDVDSTGVQINTGFVLEDKQGHQLDVHAMRLDAQGNGIPAWQVPSGFILTTQDLSGAGTVGGHPLRCQSAENQMICHTGYQLPDYQWRDLDQLQAKFGVEYPPELVSQRASLQTR